MNESKTRIKAGELWCDGFTDHVVRVEAVYESELALRWLVDGTRATLPREYFETIFYPHARMP